MLCCSIKTVSGWLTQMQSLALKQAPALLALCQSAIYIYSSQKKSNRWKQKPTKSNFTHFWNKLSSPKALLSSCPRGIIAPMERRPERTPASHTRAEDIKWRHTWGDTNLAGPKQFPDSSLTLATGVAVTLGCSVTTCSGINAASHVDVSQHIHVTGALVAPALCLELSSWVIFIKEGKMVQKRNVMQTYQDSPCLQLTRVCKLIVM